MVQAMLHVASCMLLVLAHLGLSGAADLVVAGAAVNGAVAPGDEGHFRHHAALGAGRRVHLTRGLAAEAREHTVSDVAFLGLQGLRGAPGCAATRAACRLVL